MACCCCRRSDENAQDIRSEQVLRNILKLGKGGELYETFEITITSDDEREVEGKIVNEEIDTQNKVPFLTVMLNQSFAKVKGEDRENLIADCKHLVKKRKGMLISVADEFLFISTDEIIERKALKKLRKLAKKLAPGLSLGDFEYPVERLSIRLYQNFTASDLDDPSAPLLKGNSVEQEVSSSCFCCCFNPFSRGNESFKFDKYEKSEFGWFYSEFASEEGKHTLRKSIKHMCFVSEDLSTEELKNLMKFFIEFYLTSPEVDLPEKPRLDSEDVTDFVDELTKLLKTHYGPLQEIGIEEVVIWFTHEMPPHYVYRCMQLRPKSFDNSCPSCVIS